MINVISFLNTYDVDNILPDLKYLIMLHVLMADARCVEGFYNSKFTIGDFSIKESQSAGLFNAIFFNGLADGNPTVKAGVLLVSVPSAFVSQWVNFKNSSIICLNKANLFSKLSS